MLWLPNTFCRVTRAVYRNNSTSALFTRTFQFLNKTLHEPETDPSAHSRAGRILSLQQLNTYVHICSSGLHCSGTPVFWEAGWVPGWLARESFGLWGLFFFPIKRPELCLGRDGNSLGVHQREFLLQGSAREAAELQQKCIRRSHIQSR